MTEKRVTVDFDTESYYLDGEYWESWDNYGEEMADAINELLNEESNKREQENEQLKKDKLNKIFIELRSSNELKKRELRQQLFFIELIEEILPIDDNKKRIIHQKTMGSYLND